MRTITSSGQRRDFELYVPASLPRSTLAPLVIDLPGISDAQQEAAFSGFTRPAGNSQNRADKVGAIVITPEPLAPAGNGPVWEVAGPASASADVRFLADLLTQSFAHLCADPHRVLMMGFSFGGVMAATAACQLSGKVTVLATVAGLYDPDGCPATTLPSVIAFHGIDDPVLPLAGGTGPNLARLPVAHAATALADAVAPRLIGADKTAEAWSRRLRCATNPDIDDTSAGITIFRWGGCTRGAQVQLDVLDNAGHTWPGSTSMGGLKAELGPVSNAVNASDAIWAFFLAQSRP